ncbi:MAG: YjbE family putative metal transport protein [Alphaproteobacteria bacterium]|nr:YjbE family putative metal transport protein [Alphaproteobacteria bacterium]MBL7098038.1 YjbE family putative metal transport protein [Alphaproteobacteria bacterium]
MDLLFSHGGFFALLQVVLIDIVLAGDNAVVIGMAAARVPQIVRRKVIFWGLVTAVVARVFLATITVRLLEYIGLTFAGGVLLLWVCWKLWRDIREAAEEQKAAETMDGPPAADKLGGPYSYEASTQMMRRAIVQIAAADLSMSLDNVLAVAGAARNHMVVLAIGLCLSIGLMGVAASVIARVLNKHAWISYAGLFIVLYVAISMIWRGSMAIMHAM